MKANDSTDDDPPSDDIPEDPRIIEVVEDYLRELEAGRRPVRQTFVDRYPELADAINACLEGLEMVHAGAGSQGYKINTRRALTEMGESYAASPLGDFQIVRELARGGMGVVYEAVQLSLGRRVALKVLPFAATFDSRQLQRFKNEAQAAALLHHTHIVPIYAVGCERGVHFYAMQLIEGQSLAMVIQQLRERAGRGNGPRIESTIDRGQRPQPLAAPLASQAQRSTIDVSGTITGGSSIESETYVRRAARLMVQAAEALEHAHREGVVHRDIKPANLLIDATGSLWVTDFGLAQLHADNGLTRSGDLLGTFRYMSPEQTSGQRTLLDHRTDIYSLGATFYELLALEPVFAGDTHQELLYQILHNEPRSLREQNRAVPPELETVIFKALSKSAADRYRTAGEFGADIQRYLDHQPVLARRPSLVDRIRKWSRRHPGVAIASTLVLTLVATLLFISHSRISAEQQRTKDALAREELRAKEAEQRFHQARQAVDAMFVISEEELTDRPSAAARQRILEVVLNYYQEFIEQRSGDPTSQAELAVVKEKVRTILHELTVMQREMHLRLLASDAVRRELQVTDAQAKGLTPLVDSWLAQQHQLFADRSQTDETRRSLLVANAEQHEQELAKVLSTAQRRRFSEIALQSQGLFAFRGPEVVKALGLTSQQRAALRDIERETFKRRFERGIGGPPPHIVAASDEVMREALRVLTPPQLEVWHALTGAPFRDFSDHGLPPPP